MATGEIKTLQFAEGTAVTVAVAPLEVGTPVSGTQAVNVDYLTNLGAGLKNNNSAILAPTVTNDSSQGYGVGSLWINTVTGLTYRAVDVTIGAAIWKQIVDTNSLQALSNKQINYSSSTDSTTTGTNTTAAAFTTGIIRLTNASLSSLSGIPAGGSGQQLIIENKTGSTIIINNEEATATAANRIQTGNNANANMGNNASFLFSYDTTTSRWQLVGGTGSGTGSSSSGINYLSVNPDAEISIAGWSTYADAAAIPVDLTGGTATATFARSTTNPLRGTGSFLYTPGALGNGVSYTITPDRGDVKKGAVQTLTFDYEYSATIASGAYTIWIYDVANSVLIQPTGYQMIGGVSGFGYKQICTFQLPTNATTLRVGIHQALASPGGNLIFDNLQLGPQTITYGAIVTDWQLYTPVITGLGTVTESIARWRRVGGDIELDINFRAGTASATILSISLPAGISISPSTTGSDFNRNLGCILQSYTGSDVNFNTGNVSDVYLYADTATNPNLLYICNTADSSTTTIFQKINGNQIYGGTERLSAQAKAPVQGWQSSLQLSDSADTRAVAAVLAFAGSQTVTSGVSTILKFDTITQDTHGAYNSSTGLYTVFVPGFYKIEAGIRSSQVSWSTTNQLNLSIWKGGVIFGGIGAQIAQASAAFRINITGAREFYFNAGESFGLYVDSQVTMSIADGVTVNWMTINRVSGPTAIAVSEKIVARYYSSAGQSIANGATSIIDFGTKDYDSHQSVTTGASWRFTAARADYYNISAMAVYSSASFTTANTEYLRLFKNGSLYTFLAEQTNMASATFGPVMIGTDRIYLLQGEYFDLRTNHQEAASKALSPSVNEVHITISSN